MKRIHISVTDSTFHCRLWIRFCNVNLGSKPAWLRCYCCHSQKWGEGKEWIMTADRFIQKSLFQISPSASYEGRKRFKNRTRQQHDFCSPQQWPLQIDIRTHLLTSGRQAKKKNSDLASRKVHTLVRFWHSLANWLGLKGKNCGDKLNRILVFWFVHLEWFTCTCLLFYSCCRWMWWRLSSSQSNWCKNTMFAKYRPTHLDLFHEWLSL